MSDLLKSLWQNPETEKRMAALYGAAEVENQKKRYEALAERYVKCFGPFAGPVTVFSAPGRTEIGGNHTDHNNGCVLAAAVNLDTVAVVTPRDDGVICVDSEGFPPMEISTDNLAVNEAEFGTTTALIRGTAGALKERGMKVGGFNAVITSSVARGSGLSSSAAFEVLIAAILDGLYNGFVIDAQTRAEIAQEVENRWFGKPCGLMDQMASSVGGLVAIDFEKPRASVTALNYDFAAKGYALCVVNTGGDHGDLTDDYAAIRTEMEAVAKALGGRVLRDIPREVFEAKLPEIRAKVGDRALLRAMHYYDENENVGAMVKALNGDDLNLFLSIVTRSGDSSWERLQNVYARPTEEQMALGIAISRRYLGAKGTCRVHGGGFAGTIQAYVPLDMLDGYMTCMEKVFGKGSCISLMIRPEGAVMMPV
ncbi:MAG: galactokinase [Clostridia bacterium]|nr:galactokinase [Clostridia bacterium]